MTNSKVRGQLANSVDSAVLAFVTDPGIRSNCTSVDQACFSASKFATSSQQTERVVFTLGASAYNLLNDANFASPAHNAGIAAGLSVISASVGAPSSPYGSFQGSSVNGRVMVLTGKFNF